MTRRLRSSGWPTSTPSWSGSCKQTHQFFPLPYGSPDLLHVVANSCFMLWLLNAFAQSRLDLLLRSLHSFRQPYASMGT
eukprot:5504112-Pleurochrysis_carterae.AAC.2